MTSIIKVQNIQYTDGDAALTIADGGGVTAASTLTSTGAFTSPGIDDNGDAVSLTIDSSENVTINSGNLVIGTSGKGIDFSATNQGSNTSNESELLDDYEEGDWTPGSAVGGINAEAGSKKYTRIGNIVHFHVKGSFANSSNNEAVEITGLPYAPSIVQVAGSATWRDLNTNFQGGVVLVTTNGRISFWDDGTTSTSHNQLYHNEIGSSNEVLLSGTYFI